MASNSLCSRHLVIILSFLLLMTIAMLGRSLSGVGHMQSSPCPPGAAPSPDPSGPHFKWGETVYVILDGNFLPSQEDQIKRGLDSWSAANVQNGSGVSFDYNQGPPSESFDPTIITFTQGSCPGSGITAQSVFTPRSDNTVQRATITFCTHSATTNQGRPFYDSSAPIPPGGFTNGFDNILEKQTEHEIGHPMGLNDAPIPSSGNSCDQPARASVVNNACGDNCPNDNCNHMARGVTPCDNSVISNNARPTPTPTPTPIPTPPDGGGGGGGGGCGDCYYYPYYGGGYTYCSYSCTDYYTCASYGGKTECSYQGTDCVVEECYSY